MTVVDWLIVAAVLWPLLSVAAALLLGRVIATADHHHDHYTGDTR